MSQQEPPCPPSTEPPSTPCWPGPIARSTRACCRPASSRSGFEGEIVMSETIGDATPDTRYVVYSATKAFVAGAMWAVIGDGLDRPLEPGGRPGARVRHQRQGRGHHRAGDAPHLGLPERADARHRGRHQRGALRRLRPLAPELGARHALRVPPVLGPLGAGRAPGAGHRPGLPRRRPGPRHRPGRAPPGPRPRAGHLPVRRRWSPPASPPRPTSSRPRSACASSPSPR